jgi:hypothetical protein
MEHTASMFVVTVILATPLASTVNSMSLDWISVKSRTPLSLLELEHAAPTSVTAAKSDNRMSLRRFD